MQIGCWRSGCGMQHLCGCRMFAAAVLHTKPSTVTCISASGGSSVPAPPASQIRKIKCRCDSVIEMLQYLIRTRRAYRTAQPWCHPPNWPR